MAALVQVFIDVLEILVTFVLDYLVPAAAADVTILHVAIWTPVIIGLVSLTVGMFKGMFKGRSKRAA